MKVTIHQPNFFPHQAFFEKMKMADKFVFLTQCQFEKNGYQNRFKHNDKWYTMSVNKGLEKLLHKRYVNHMIDWNKILKTFPKLSDFNYFVDVGLVATNIMIITEIKKVLNINTSLYYDMPTKLTGTERLVDICVKYNATEYISGPSGRKYLNLDLFDQNGIKVTFQEPSESKSIIEVL